MSETFEEARPSPLAAAAAVDAIEQSEQLEQSAKAQDVRPVVQSRAEADEAAAYLRKIRMPLINAYLDMRVEATGHHRVDETAVLEMDFLRQITERAKASS